MSSIAEGYTDLGSVSASEEVTWSISGSDVSISSGGTVRLNHPANYDDAQSHEFTISATDTANNVTSQQFTVQVIEDVTGPLINDVCCFSNPEWNRKPSFSFSSSEAGTLSSNYPFSSTSAVSVGDNTITWESLTPGVYDDITITVTDVYGNETVFSVPTFEIVNGIPKSSDSYNSVLQSTADIEQIVTITLSASDSDFDNLIFEVLSAPNNGRIF